MSKRVHGIEADEFKRVIEECDTYGEAAVQLGVHIKTIGAWAKKLNCLKTGHNGGGARVQFLLQDILDGKHPQYPTFLLKKRLLKEDIKEDKCDECGITEWNGNSITIEMDHINGNRHDHSLENLRMLCPNCHSQTATYKSLNKNMKK
jgi:5-methylcytosine-specific restriction endonuclease McrA